MRLRRRFNVSSLINRIELTAFDRVEKDFGGLLYAFEEGVILGGASRRFLVRVMAKNLFAVGPLDLSLCSFVAVFGQAEDGIVILSLRLKESAVAYMGHVWTEKIPSSPLRPAAASADLQAR